MSAKTLTELVLVSANDFADEALRLMRKQRLSQVGVLQGNRVIGLVYRSELEQADRKALRTTDVLDWSHPNPHPQLLKDNPAPLAQTAAGV